jgi:hypothetical protein
LYCLERRDEAKAALAEAIRRNRHVPKMLARERGPAPKGERFGVALGSREEAFIYCESARVLWAAAPGALAWLSRHAAGRG